MALESLLNVQFAGNSGYEYAFSGSLFILISLGLYLFRTVLLHQLHVLASKTDNKIDDVIIHVLRRIGVSFYVVVALYISVQHLVLPSVILFFLEAAVLVVIVHEAVELLDGLSILFFLNEVEKIEGAIDLQKREKASSIVGLIMKIVLWTIGLMLILSNLGFNVNSLIASLGVGGIAVSLALQNILGDLFSSFSIAFDKPFKVGDVIRVENELGVVTKIGLKTTRLRALEGEEIIVSNQHLTTSQILNYKRMELRKAQYDFSVGYSTTIEQLRTIPALVEQAVRSTVKTTFKRVVLLGFNDGNYKFSLEYRVLSQDYGVYLETLHGINMSLLESFAKSGIQIGVPMKQELKAA